MKKCLNLITNPIKKHLPMAPIVSIRFRFYILTACLFLFLAPVFAQYSDFEILDEPRLEKNYGQNNFYTTLSLSYKKEKKGNTAEIEKAKSELIEKLKIKLVEKISSKVEVNNSIQSTQVDATNVDGNNKAASSTVVNTTSNFSTNIQSKLSIQNPKFKWYDDNAKSTLHGFIVIDKNDLIEQLNASYEHEIKSLLNKIVAYENNLDNSRLDQNNYNELSKQRMEINNLGELVNRLVIKKAFSIEQESAQNIADIDRKLNVLRAKIETTNFQDQLIATNESMNQGQFSEAMQSYGRLMIRYPENASIISAQNNALRKIKAIYDNKINTGDYLYNLEAVEEAEAIDYNLVEYYKPRKDIFKRQAFEQYINKAMASMDRRDYTNAKLYLDKISAYQSINQNQYNALVKKIGENIVLDRKREIQAYIDAKEYVNAYHLIIETKKDYTISSADNFNQLENKVIDYLTELKVKELKSTRPFVYQIQFGAGILSNFLSVQTPANLQGYTVQSASTVYEFGLYRKIGIHPKFSRYGRDKSSANAIGARLSVWVPSIIYNPNSATIKDLYFQNNVYEPQLSFYMLRMFNLNFGKLVGELIDPVSVAGDGASKDFYTFTFGLRPRIRNLMFNANAKLISNLDKRNYVSANLSVALAFNFKRKFKSSEYDVVKSKIKLLKDY